jgi:hypothetical protein
VEEAPRTTVLGLSVSELNVGAGGGGGGGAGFTVTAVDLLVPPRTPVIPTTVVAVTAEVVIPKEADELPAPTATLEGTWTTAGLDL